MLLFPNFQRSSFCASFAHPKLIWERKGKNYILQTQNLFFIFLRTVPLNSAPFFGVQKYVTQHIPPNLFQPFFNPFNSLTPCEVRPFFHWECKCRSTCLNNQIFFRNSYNFFDWFLLKCFKNCAFFLKADGKDREISFHVKSFEKNSSK